MVTTAEVNTTTKFGWSAIPPATPNPYELTKRELEELDGLQREHIERESRILQERSGLSDKQTEARGKLEQARKRLSGVALAVASGGKDDVLESANEIKRLESLIDGYGQLYETKTAELRDQPARLIQLAQKRATSDTFAESMRLGEEVRITEEKLKAARESIPVLENAAMQARMARANQKSGI